MKALCFDLLSEYRALAALVERLSPEQWALPSAFYGWTPYDEIAHLCLFDELALLATTDSAEFREQQRQIEATMARGHEISQIARVRFSGWSGARLTEYWRSQFVQLTAILERLEPKARLPWFGPDMSARSFATARLMETWAHGQDVYDVLRLSRPASARLRHIAHLGVVTFDWTFVNRGLPVPGPAPRVELFVPGCELWSWNEPSPSNCVRGPADDFCLVVTQRRHYLDTSLALAGSTAVEWMRIAQCFAGPPADGPAPGTRVVLDAAIA
ncbi:TIGR03084 family metal-binding protein [Steroidobacter sp.]|uniref:TIGR03084 family metal-binding protein n=1 Tax=Steroidobacter sp. TaxID=1978227 RepID=UPI001A3BC4A4|nr:TIGR03084 family metal-binding protein [Steroidobacter sp.]MBL8265346.1 TIGR03084 family protein [Steroidobacter sp.]